MPEPVKPAWSDPHPEIPYLPKPPVQPRDFLKEHAPVNPNATPEAKALLHFLYQISGRQTLTGQHNFPDRREYSTQRAVMLTGKTPALYGSDWGFAKIGDKDSAYVRQDLVEELIRQWGHGSVITLCWHAVPPTEDEPVTFAKEIQSRLTDVEFDALLTPGTEIYQKWCAQVDSLVPYFHQLQDARVPVLWRPYHEINGDWFWWNGYRGNGAHGTKQLYRQIYDRLVNVHHLNNLLWVWNPDRPSRADREFVDYFPGHGCVDVLALDCYGPFEQRYYDDLNALSDGKVLAVGETFHSPAIDVYEAQPKWAYTMTWATDTPADGGPADHPHGDPALTALVNAPRMLNLDDPAYRRDIAAVKTVGV